MEVPEFTEGGRCVRRRASILKTGTYAMAGSVLVSVDVEGSEIQVLQVHRTKGTIDRADIACPCGRVSTIIFEYEDGQ